MRVISALTGFVSRIVGKILKKKDVKPLNQAGAEKTEGDRTLKLGELTVELT